MHDVVVFNLDSILNFIETRFNNLGKRENYGANEKKNKVKLFIVVAYICSIHARYVS